MSGLFNFFHGVGVAIGSAFIAIGGFLGAHQGQVAVVPAPPVATTTNVATQAPASTANDSPSQPRKSSQVTTTSSAGTSQTIPVPTVAVAPQTTNIQWPVTTSGVYVDASNYKGAAAYRLFVSITNNHAGGHDIYIPRTTSGDGKGQVTGFFYQIDGDRFFGDQKATVTCPTWNDANYCIVKFGETVKFEVAVVLNPSVQGNYSVNFTKFNWTDNYQGNAFGSVSLNKETDVVNAAGI